MIIYTYSNLNLNCPNGLLRLSSERAGHSVEIEKDLVQPFLRGEDVDRYTAPKNLYYCIYPYKLVAGKTKIIDEVELEKKFPKGYAYLKEYRKELTDIRERQKTNSKYWYSCHRSRDMNVFESERIITPEISLGCNMTIAPAGMYHNTKVYSIVPSGEQKENRNYWLGLLNSRVHVVVSVKHWLCASWWIFCFQDKLSSTISYSCNQLLRSCR